MTTLRTLSTGLMSLLLVLSALLAAPVLASDSDAEERIRERFADLIPSVQVRSVTASEVPDFYQVSTDESTIYVSGDGQYVLLGEMLRLDPERGVVNLTDEARNGERKAAIEALSAEDMISYPPEGEVKAQMYVFTDIDCGYCRSMHAAMADFHAEGIQINYLGFPRAGPNSASHTKLVSAWCADDQQAAMDQAKAGRSIPEKSCSNPISDQLRLGQALGVSGTPATVLADGRLLPGFRPAADMARVLGIK
ncbi:MAG: DsbC family protein [Halomonadaceae bacterium]|nr:MAG: DsbC family protein [Halomonadaceae bacterium]